MKLWKYAGFLPFLILFAPATWSVDIVVPSPKGLNACTPESPLLDRMKRVASQFGSLSGCFVSSKKVQMNGMDEPLEFASAITLAQGTSGPFTTADVDKLYATVEKQWENVQPLWSQDRAAYERYVQQLMQKTSPSSSAPGNMSIDQPVLVSMQRMNSSAYTVVSIRRRQVSKDGETLSINTADGSAIVLSKGSLVRLTIQRQFRGQNDVNAIQGEIKAWVRSW